MSVETVATTAPAQTPDVPYERLGRPISGPRAMTGSWRRFAYLTLNIAIMNWKLRFFGSWLGYVWQLVRPLMLFAVLYLFFTKVARVGDQPGASYHYYGAQLLSGIVLFTFFGEATAGSIRCVVDGEPMVRKIQFPRLALPLASVLLAFFNVCLNLLVVLIFALIAGVRPMLTWLEVPLAIGLLVVLCTGIAMLLSALFVYFRDIQPIWEVVSQILFYTAPIIITVVQIQAQVSPGLFHLYMLNPLSLIFQQFKHTAINPDTPSVGSLLGSQAQLAIPIAIVLAVFALGLWTFNRIAPRVAEDL